MKYGAVYRGHPPANGVPGERSKKSRKLAEVGYVRASSSGWMLRSRAAGENVLCDSVNISESNQIKAYGMSACETRKFVG